MTRRAAVSTPTANGILIGYLRLYHHFSDFLVSRRDLSVFSNLQVMQSVPREKFLTRIYGVQ